MLRGTRAPWLCTSICLVQDFAYTQLAFHEGGIVPLYPRQHGQGQAGLRRIQVEAGIDQLIVLHDQRVGSWDKRVGCHDSAVRGKEVN